MESPVNPYSPPVVNDPPLTTDKPAAPAGSLRGAIWGLRIVFFGLLAIVVAESILALYSIPETISQPSDDVFHRLYLLWNFGELLCIVGVLLSLTAPRDIGSRRFIQLAAAAAVVRFAFAILRRLRILFRGINLAFVRAPLCVFGLFLITVALQIAFVLYLRRLALFVHRRKLIVAVQRLLAIALGIAVYEFWDFDYFHLDSPHRLRHTEGDFVAHNVLLILRPAAYILAAILIQALAKALSEREARRRRASIKLS